MMELSAIDLTAIDKAGIPLGQEANLRKKFPMKRRIRISICITLIFLASFTPGLCRSQTTSGDSARIASRDSAALIIQQELKVKEAGTPASITISAAGDVMLGSWVADYINRFDVNYPFDSTRHLIEASDLAIANLEAPLTKTGTMVRNKTYTFKVPPAFVRGIKNAGIDVVTLANNHMIDFGCEGLMNTIAALDSAGIRHCGAGENLRQASEPAIVEVSGMKIAFVGFSLAFPKQFWAKRDSCGTCFAEKRLLARVLKQCEKTADMTVVSFHWGEEKRTTPKEYQIQLAHQVIDLGADLVLGHHPHVLQGLEIYKNRLIAYSLGNYVFGSYSMYARTSMVLQVEMDETGLIRAQVVPISVYNYEVQFQPKILRKTARQAVLDDLRSLSRALNAGKAILNENGIITPQK
jgi:poly-gamma-glutamate capsule biosynthesis protein CapA/YwtB (metallophosphatase superfamily)